MLEIIILLLVVIIAICIYYSSYNAESKDHVCTANLIAFVCTSILFCAIVIMTSKPKAIDVYRGKTELKVTIIDKSAVDSIVVWKK